MWYFNLIIFIYHWIYMQYHYFMVIPWFFDICVTVSYHIYIILQATSSNFIVVFVISLQVWYFKVFHGMPWDTIVFYYNNHTVPLYVSRYSAAITKVLLIIIFRFYYIPVPWDFHAVSWYCDSLIDIVVFKWYLHLLQQSHGTFCC